MSIDCIESLDDVGDVFAHENRFTDHTTSLWNGRNVQQIVQRDTKSGTIHQSYAQALQHTQELVNSLLDAERCDFIDLDEEIADEMDSHLDDDAQIAFTFARPSQPDFALASLTYNQTEILVCKSFLKSAVKGVKKCSKKVSKKVKKGAEKVAHFVKEHKTEILIGLAVVAAITGVYVVSGALVAGAGATQIPEGSGRRREDEDEPPSSVPELKTISRSNLTAHAQVHTPSHHPAPTAPIIAPPVNSSSTNPIKNAIMGVVGGIQRGVETLFSYFSSKKTPTPTVAEPRKSCVIKTEGVKKPGVQIGFINGMNTSLSESEDHMEHLKQFAGNLRIEGVYNHSNTAPVDIGEIILLNYGGVAPNTGKLLVENWTRFHEENVHNPEAKYLQFTHSMGNILAKDALQMAPKEIRDRVIVVAIAPAVIIPEGLCHDSFHYASKKDIVHYGENAHTLWMAAFNEEEEQRMMYDQLRDNKERLMILEPRENAEGLDHDFESPTFHELLRKHVKVYLENSDESQ